jgi:hypothetical protein
VRLVFDYAARPGASARRAARHQLLHLLRASGCFGSSCGLSCDSSLTTSPHAGSSSTTSPTPRVRVPRHVARLVVDYSGLRTLVVYYFDYAAHPGALERLAARRQLLHLRRASGCFGSSRGLWRDSSSTTSPRAGSSSTTSPTSRVRVPRHVAGLVTRLVVVYSTSRRLVVDYFDYDARPVASARRAARHAARCRLLRLRRASGCLGSSCGSLSTTPRVRVPQHVVRLVINYFTYYARPVALARRAACRVTHRRLLRLVQARH